MTPYYDDGTCVIYHGDCRERLDEVGRVQLAFADPPYGVGFKYGNAYADEAGAEYAALIKRVERALSAVADVVLATPGIRNLWEWPTATWVLAWNKPGSPRRSDLGGFNTWEPVLVYGKRRVYQDAVTLPAWSNTAGTAAEDHPCPKPLRLMRWLIGDWSNPGDTVLDPFMGSGTTLRAAKDLGRRAIGIEIEERYCEIAANRLAQEVLDFGEAS